MKFTKMLFRSKGTIAVLRVLRRMFDGLDFGIHAEMTDFPAWLDTNDESSSLVTSTKRCIVKGYALGSPPNMSVSPL